MEVPWRVRDKYNVVPDASSQPPLLADDSIDSIIRSFKVCSLPRIRSPSRPTQLQLTPLPGNYEPYYEARQRSKQKAQPVETALDREVGKIICADGKSPAQEKSA